MVRVMRSFIAKHRLTLIGLVVGAVIGLMYWWFIGCTNGSCSITSSPVNSSIWGAVLGALVFSSFEKDKETKK